MSYIAFVSLSSSVMLSSPYARSGFLVFHMRFPCIPVTVLQLSMTGVCVCVCVCVCARTCAYILCENVGAVHRVGGVFALVHRSECKSSYKMLIKIVHSK